jgi:hypothetical protein
VQLLRIRSIKSQCKKLQRNKKRTDSQINQEEDHKRDKVIREEIDVNQIFFFFCEGAESKSIYTIEGAVYRTERETDQE